MTPEQIDAELLALKHLVRDIDWYAGDGVDLNEALGNVRGKAFEIMLMIHRLWISEPAKKETSLDLKELGLI